MVLPTGVAVIGDDRFALALAHLCAESGARVWLYAPNADRRKKLAADRALPSVLGEVESLNDGVTISEGLDALAGQVRLVFFTETGDDIESLLIEAGGGLDGSHYLVHAAHSLYGPDLQTTGALIRDLTPCLQIGAIAGPVHVGELLGGQPNAIVIGSPYPDLVARVKTALSRKNLRVYSRADLLGVELAAVLIQPIAVVTGLADGMKLGAATHATLIVRGLAEMTRVGRRLGASPETFVGLAGLGRLLDAARRGDDNYDLGKSMAAGLSGAELLEAAPPEGQGVRLFAPIRRYAETHGIWAPICTTMDRVSRGEITPQEGLQALLETEARGED